jgi:oligopeptide/dipeptide ABC transporter ATP-binding protein
MSLLQVRRLGINYADVAAVRDLSFEVAAGESVGLVGESGSGKTQTALAIMGLLPKAATATGEIRFDGEQLLHASEAALDRLRAVRLAMVFQDPMQALNPFVKVGRQLRHILAAHNLAEGKAADERVIAMLERVRLPDPQRQFSAYPHQLSGGMRQRVMLASALIGQPDLLIADEPSTALDVTVQAQILELLEEIRDDTALLLITHDLGIVAGRCERMLVMEQGELVESGQTGAVFAAPQHRHTRTLIEAAPRLDRGATLSPITSSALFTIDAASVSYVERGKGRLQAVQDLSVTLQQGETVAIVGESGSGKSSLVRAVLGLVPLQSGRVTYCGSELGYSLKSRSAEVRRDLQLVFQDPVASLNPQMRVRAIIAEPLLVHERSLQKSERQQLVQKMLHKVGLDESFLSRYPHQLSGGQAQRVAIARALVLGPKVLICDEAVAALDGSVRQQILEMLLREQRESGLSIFFITHDLAVARAISHRVLVMYLGRLVELAASEALFKHARHPYTAALLEAVPVPDPRAAGGYASLAGEVPSILNPPSGCAFHPRCAHSIEVCEQSRPPPRPFANATVACHRVEELAGPE